MTGSITALLLVLACATFVSAQSIAPKTDLPELNVVREITLSPTYSCRAPEEFTTGYARTALFVSEYSKRRNSPDLLFNGACKSEDYFESSTAGDDMALIADLGTVPFDEVSASRALNFRRVNTPSDYSEFRQTAVAAGGHTYAVLINKSDIRGLLVFAVTGYTPNTSVSIKYAVKSYEVLRSGSRAAGFSWEKKSK